jgi:hypothetical protein
MSTDFVRLETAWDALRQAIEDRIVARSRGLPVDDADHPAMRRDFADALAAIDVAAMDDEERRGLACIRSGFGALASYDPMDDLEVDEETGAESLIIAALRRSTYDAYGEAASALVVGGEVIDRLTAFARLATAEDPIERRRVFEAMAPIWQVVDGDGHRSGPYRQLVAAAADRWARDGSPIDAGAVVLGIGPGDLEPMLWRILAAGRDVVTAAAGLRTGRRIAPWDYRFVVGAADRQLLSAVPVERLRPINDAHLRSLGADPIELSIGYDIFPRPDRPVIPVAFSTGGRPGPWVFASYREGGIGNLNELLHESGHALHFAAIRARPAFVEAPEEDAAFFEAFADVLGWDADEPAFQERYLGRSARPAENALARYGNVLLDVCWSLFEIELYRAPGRRPNDVWAEIVADGLGVEPHPEWSWWAVRGQLIDLPGYMANYALSAIAAAALRARIRELRGDWSTGDPGWYAFVSDRLLQFGGARTPADLIADLLGGPLTEAPLLADLARAGAV